jgi:hypothetical protein
MKKKFFLAAEDIKELVVPEIGFCLATDKIMVKGLKVGYMYRESPDNEEDSGWRFLAGTETNAYLDNSENSGVYLVNTVANYDTAIIPYLHLPYGSELERIEDSDEFELMSDE